MTDRKGTILVVGGTGRTGRAVIRRLWHRQPRPSIRVLSRNADIAKNMFGDDVEICQGDVSNQAVTKEAMIDVTRIIYCVGPQLLDDIFKSSEPSLVKGLSNLLSEGKKGILNQVVLVSAAGLTRPLHIWHPLSNIFFGYVSLNRLRQEHLLRESGVDYVIIRPHSLADVDFPEPVTVSQGDVSSFGAPVSRAALAETIIHSMYDGLAPSKVTFEIWGKSTEWTMADGFDWSVAFRHLQADDDRFPLRCYEFSHRVGRVIMWIVLVSLTFLFLTWFLG